MADINAMKEENFLRLRTRTVRRCLWKVDHESLRRDLDREQADMQKELNNKYNFDFSKSVAFKGRYDWESTQTSVPSNSRGLRSQVTRKKTRSTSQKRGKGFRRRQQKKSEAEKGSSAQSSTISSSGNLQRRPQGQARKSESSSPPKKKPK